ncbi:MAG: helix-turn-helix domain-containing protein [Lentisphaeria bacterium]|nr:helix-turn-helix domain-containing protein [Lentisphaeria bacterium]
MPDVKQVLQEEIRRLAKKEVKQAVAPLAALASELKRRVAQLERQLAGTEKKIVPAPAAKQEEGDKAAASKKEKTPRFHGKKIARLRKRLHLSQAELAEMVGVNMFSVSHWELGKNVPRPAQQKSLEEIRVMPRKELRQRLAVVHAALRAKKGKKENPSA